MPAAGKTNPRFAAALARAARPNTTLISPKKTANDAAGSSSDLSSPPASDIEDVPTKGSSQYFHKTATTTSIKKQELPETSIAREPTPETGDLVPPIPAKAKPSKQKQISPKKKTAAPAKQKALPPPTPTPKNWEEIYTLVQKMRLENPTAPVDTMGCEHLHSRTASPLDRRFQTLISLMLSSQTKDTVNAVAMEKLHTQLPGGLNLKSILEVEPAVLGKLIDVVGFHRRKTEYIKKTAEILRDKWKGDIPDTAEGLMSLPGVGPKMAHLCMSSAWGKTEGIGVDVHVHRITNLWKWQQTTTPEQTRAALESWLPKEKWHEINHLLVGFGQTICLPRGRKCGECLLSAKGLCPAAFKGETAAPGKRKKKVVKTEVMKEESDEEVDGEEVWKEEAVGVGMGGEFESPRRSVRKRVKIEYKEEDDEDGAGVGDDKE